jgi:uncharacterized cupredoxin-like copper-binding protein
VTLRRALGGFRAAVLVAAAGACRSDGVRTVEISIRHSRFDPGAIEVAPGDRVRFVIHNGDPINHEFILGDLDLQRVHERGEQPHHARPGEVSVPAGGTVTTAYTFGDRGALLFGCHLPGHWAYGMWGTVRVG